jgi:hypothetical protein
MASNIISSYGSISFTVSGGSEGDNFDSQEPTSEETENIQNSDGTFNETKMDELENMLSRELRKHNQVVEDMAEALPGNSPVTSQGPPPRSPVQQGQPNISQTNPPNPTSLVQTGALIGPTPPPTFGSQQSAYSANPMSHPTTYIPAEQLSLPANFLGQRIGYFIGKAANKLFYNELCTTSHSIGPAPEWAVGQRAAVAAAPIISAAASFFAREFGLKYGQSPIIGDVAAPLAEEVTARYVSSDPDVIRLLGRCVKSGVAATVGQDLAYLAIEFMTTEYGERGPNARECHAMGIPYHRK